jgi:hypothetical protein
MRIETGKYYVDGEGFYHCLEEALDGIHVRMRTVQTSRMNGLDIRTAILLRDGCENRMVECSEEQFEKAEKMVNEAIRQLDEYNSDVFYPLWEARKMKEEKWLSSAEIVEAWNNEEE